MNTTVDNTTPVNRRKSHATKGTANYDTLARTEKPTLPWGWNILRKIDREAARNRRPDTWDGFAKKVSPRTAQAAENAYVKQIFGDNRNLDFNDCLSAQFEELPELDVEHEARAEWEEKPALPPELLVFTTTCRDIASQLFDEAPKISISGTREANNSDTYDGADYDEAPSVLEQETEDAEAETEGERDGAEHLVDTLNEDHKNENWLRNAYAELLWSYDQLSTDAKNEYHRLYQRLKRALIRQSQAEGITLRPGDFRKNRTYLLDYEEREMFTPQFRDDKAEPPKKAFSVPKKAPKSAESLKELFLCQLKQAKNR